MGTEEKRNKERYSLALFQHQRREQELRRQQECEQRWPEAKAVQRKEERGKEDKRAVEDEQFAVDGQRKSEKKQVCRVFTDSKAQLPVAVADVFLSSLNVFPF